MSIYYNARRSRNIYDSGLKEPFRLSRSKIDDFKKCQRCFYMDVKLGVAQPPGYPFSLNNAVDKLLKKEFDIYRAKGTRHPLMAHYRVDAVPFQHPRIDDWRNARQAGITHYHEATNFLITGGIDDVWVNPQGELIIVDYKATAKDGEVNINAEWQDGYKRQMEVYQWLFRKSGFTVSNVGYFVYCNGNTDKAAFDAKLEFDIKLIPYEGNDRWVEDAVKDAYYCLNGKTLPPANRDCDFCNYRWSAREVVKDFDLSQ